ncbi:unnamed protein product [Phaedon cochleariae]|uniref:Uncharacterized protein n=1 Tax=Phaedon cochleariae TaxID=80249 RepID=A0A9P0DY42_PHACE|nr:unnamed protein product [Phaedon cochleariae]
MSTSAITICVYILVLHHLAETSHIIDNYNIDNHVVGPRDCVNNKNIQKLAIDPNLNQLRHKLSKFIKGNKHKKREATTSSGKHKTAGNPKDEKAENKSETDQQWDEWSPWSSCSVSCGKGRHIRWRHCRQKCDGVETEMEQKLCQLPACPQKLFGLIKL